MNYAQPAGGSLVTVKVKKCFTMIRIICFGSYLDINIHMYAVVHLSLVNMIVLGVKYVSCVTLMSLV